MPYHRHRLFLLLPFALSASAQDAPAPNSASPGEPKEQIVVLDRFVAEEKVVDKSNVLPGEAMRSVVGFDRPLPEIPRAVYVVNSSLLDNLAIRNSEDLIKIAPSTYSNFRFGLQGNISIRNQTSDFYFRGMKRIDPQGNFRTLWTANDSLEIVRGPASPIYGLGRIGGYVNFNPKTARLANTGKYLDHYTGQFRLTVGSFGKKIMTGEVGGPATIPFVEKKGGFHIYSYIENSDAWKINNFDQQELVQATLSLDLSPNVRLETGGVVQHSRGGLPGGINRTTVNTIGRHTYWDGGFSYQLDENRDGQISEREVRNSYFRGTPQFSALTNDPARIVSGIGASAYYNGQVNDPLFRVVPWQGNLGAGLAKSLNPSTITIDQFRTGYTDASPTLVGGTAVQRMGYELLVYPTKNITLASGKVDAVPDTSKAPQKFFLPPAFDLDPDTWVEKPLNKRQSFGEDYYDANIGAFFLDFLNDHNIDYSIKNQTLIDAHKQTKDGHNPFSQLQAVFTAENKTTYQRKFKPKEWFVLDTLASANVYYLDTYRVSTVPTDIDFRRSLQHDDASRVNETFTPNDTFYSMIARRGYDGSPPSFTAKSHYTNAGIGFLTDMTFFNKINVLAGGRWDYIDAWTREPAGTYEKGGSTNPGAPYSFYAATGLFTPVNYDASAHDSDKSWSTSLSYEVLKGVRFYGTYAEQALIINNASAQEFSVRPLLVGQLLGQSKMDEGGLKVSLLKGRLFGSAAYFEQTRTAFDANSTVGGAASSTLSRGWEGDLRWVMNKQWTFISGAAFSQAKYLQGGTISVDARSLGYPDVVDSTGKVVIPAEAMGWGGRLYTVIPDSEPDYREVEGIPDRILNFTAIYTPTAHWVFQGTVYHQGTMATDRLHTIHVPAASTIDGLIGYRTKKWEVNVNIVNIFNKEIWNRGSFYWLDPKFHRAVDVSWVYKF
jgi:iron complex outermembrane receptor protein